MFLQHHCYTITALLRVGSKRTPQAAVHRSCHKVHTAAIAVGANVGDRLANIRAALQLLPEHGVEISRYSRLYESEAAYVTDQPAFLNAALAANIHHSPRQLLKVLKEVEVTLGRNLHGQRWGPRPIDLDIIFYDDVHHEDDVLQIPHPRWSERSFVTAPLADLYPQPSQLAGRPGLAARLQGVRHVRSTPGHPGADDSGLRCVLPLPGHRFWPWEGRTAVMGILNVTPDSFSGDGQLGVAEMVKQGQAMVAEGADFLDVGGQSTRPGAQWLSPEEELQRVLPVIRALREDATTQDVMLSVDTFYSRVAAQAVSAGADLVNDVSGGLMDPDMFAQVAQQGVPYILMHMRGTPATMQSKENTTYAAVCQDVGRELQEQAGNAIQAGIEPWRLIMDPGIGFAKTAKGNLELIAGLEVVRKQLHGPLPGMPMLVGPSRKGFLGKLTGRKEAADRDVATAAAAALCVAHGANIVRAHNVAAVCDAVRVADAVNKARPA